MDTVSIDFNYNYQAKPHRIDKIWSKDSTAEQFAPCWYLKIKHNYKDGAPFMWLQPPSCHPLPARSWQRSALSLQFLLKKHKTSRASELLVQGMATNAWPCSASKTFNSFSYFFQF